LDRERPPRIVRDMVAAPTPDNDEHFVVTVNVKRITRTQGMIKGDRHVRDVLNVTVTEESAGDAIQKAMMMLRVEADTRGITIKER